MKIPRLEKKSEVKSCHNTKWEDNYSWVHQKNIIEVLKYQFLHGFGWVEESLKEISDIAPQETKARSDDWWQWLSFRFPISALRFPISDFYILARFPGNGAVEDIAVGLVAVVIHAIAPPSFHRGIVESPHLRKILAFLGCQVGQFMRILGQVI